MKYSIHTATLKAVAELREMQVMRKRDIWLKDCGRVPAGIMDAKRIAPLSFRNGGEPIMEVFPVALMAKWARLVPAPELAVEFTPKGIRLSAGGSVAEFYHASCTYGADLGALISLEAPDGGEFRLGATADPAETVKAEKKRMRDAVKRESIARKAGLARGECRTVAKTAQAAVAEARKAAELVAIAGLFSVASARRMRDAKRLMRAARGNLEAVPAWLTDDERSKVTALQSGLAAARAALASYKPRLTLRPYEKRWAKRDGLTAAECAEKYGIRKYGPKHTELTLAVKECERRLRDELTYAAARHLASLGIHRAINLAWGYGAKRCTLSEARRTLKAWPTRRLELASRFNDAWHEFRAVASKLKLAA